MRPNPPNFKLMVEICFWLQSAHVKILLFTSLAVRSPVCDTCIYLFHVNIGIYNVNSISHCRRYNEKRNDFIYCIFIHDKQLKTILNVFFVVYNLPTF